MSVVVYSHNEPTQFRGLFSKLWAVVSTGLDVTSLNDAAGATVTVAVPGVALGDMVIGFSISVSTAGITVTSDVTADNLVSIRFQNESGGTLDLAPATVRLLVARPDNQAFRALAF